MRAQQASAVSRAADRTRMAALRIAARVEVQSTELSRAAPLAKVQWTPLQQTAAERPVSKMPEPVKSMPL
jgi:hypothetical protein